MIDLKKIFKTLGINIGLIVVFASILNYFGIDIDLVVSIASGMVGLQLIISLLINVLKWAGSITDGTAGYVSAALNLTGVGVIAISLYFNPQFDFATLDAQLVDIARFGALLFSYLVQIAGTKLVHGAVTYGFGVRAFSNRLSKRA